MLIVSLSCAVILTDFQVCSSVCSSNTAVLPFSEKLATKPFSSTHIPFRNSSLSDISPDGTEVTVRRELFKLPEADDAELFCKEASEFALPAVQEDRNTAVINAVAVIENKNRFFFILIPF